MIDEDALRQMLAAAGINNVQLGNVRLYTN